MSSSPHIPLLDLVGLELIQVICESQQAHCVDEELSRVILIPLLQDNTLVITQRD